MFFSTLEEEAEVDRLEEDYHVLRNNGSMVFFVNACFHCNRGAPGNILACSIRAASREGLIMVILPLLGVGPAGAHSNTIVRTRKHKVAEAALLLGNQWSKRLLNGFG